MIGRTNCGTGGGGGSDFVAYIQVSTDPNAQISVVNLHGDAFSGTADSTGALLLTVTASGTYTVAETGGGTASILVIDYGVSYLVSVYAFDGKLVDRGTLSEAHTLEGIPIRWTDTSGYMISFSLTENTYVTISGQLRKVLEIDGTSSQNSAMGIVVTEDTIDLTNYTGISMTSYNQAFAPFGIGIFESINRQTYRAPLIAGTAAYSGYGVSYLDISSYTGEYYVGAYFQKSSSPSLATCYIEDLVLV